MEKPSTYIVGSPLYEKTQGAETNRCIVGWNIFLGFFTAILWVGPSRDAWIVQSDTPLLIKAPVLVTTLLLFDRAVWMVCHISGKWAVTDTPEAHNFERTNLLILLASFLLSKPQDDLNDKMCASKPYAAVIVEKGKEVTIDINKDNTLGICEFIQNDASSTLMWAFCTVPLLLLFGTGWKTLKATSKQSKKETVWLPIVSNLLLLPTAFYWLLTITKAVLNMSCLFLKLWIRKIRKKNQ